MTTPHPEQAQVEALREQAHEAARQALSDAMSAGHPLGGAMAISAASESEAELREAIDALALAALRPQAPQPEAAEPVPAPVPDNTDPIVGHKTFSNGLSFRHEPLRASEAERIMAEVDDAKKRRAEQMPTEQDAVRAMWEAYHRLEELGWRNATYCPRDGRPVLFIEAGSSGIHEGHCDDQDRAHRRPTVWLHDAGDLWPSQPVLYRELPAALAQAGDKEQQT